MARSDSKRIWPHRGGEAPRQAQYCSACRPGSRAGPAGRGWEARQWPAMRAYVSLSVEELRMFKVLAEGLRRRGRSAAGQVRLHLWHGWRLNSRRPPLRQLMSYVLKAGRVAVAIAPPCALQQCALATGSRSRQPDRAHGLPGPVTYPREGLASRRPWASPLFRVSGGAHRLQRHPGVGSALQCLARAAELRCGLLRLTLLLQHFAEQPMCVGHGRLFRR